VFVIGLAFNLENFAEMRPQYSIDVTDDLVHYRPAGSGGYLHTKPRIWRPWNHTLLAYGSYKDIILRDQIPISERLSVAVWEIKPARFPKQDGLEHPIQDLCNDYLTE